MCVTTGEGDCRNRAPCPVHLFVTQTYVLTTQGLSPRPVQNFAQGEAGETRDNVAEAVGLGSVLSTQSGWSKWRG